MFAAAGLWLLGVGRSAGQGLIAWLSRRSLAELGALALAIICAVQFLSLKAERRHSAKLQVQIEKCDAARKSDREAYAKAQAEAASQNRAQVTKVEQQSQRISDDERQAYLGDLAKLRADNQRLRGQAAKGSAGQSGSSTAPAPASGADADGLQVPPADDVREEAAEIELRLMHLQNWVAKQLAIDPNEPTEPPAR